MPDITAKASQCEALDQGQAPDIRFAHSARKPQRTCVSCRRRTDQDSLLRVARNADELVGAWKGSGRSAYICPDPECLTAAFTRSRLERALKCRVTEANRIALQEELKCKLR